MRGTFFIGKLFADTSNGYEEDDTNKYSSTLTINNYQRKRKATISSIDHDIEVGSIYGFETPLLRQISTDGTSMSQFGRNLLIDNKLVNN